MIKRISTTQHALIAALFLGFFFSACQSGSPSGEGSDTLRIAVIPKGTTHVFWKSIHAGAAKAAQELGVEIDWQGPLKEDDRQMQIQVVQNFVSRGVDGIVLAPLDSRALTAPVRAADRRDIPVVIIDSGLESEDYKSFIATNNYEGGRMCAQRMVELLEGQGKILVLRYMEGSASTMDRERGFLEGMAELGPEIEILSDNQYAGATMEKAFQASQNLLNRFDQVDGIFCPNESATQGMLRALQTASRAGSVKFVGFDANETLIQAMRNGEVHGLAVQDPFNMGYLGVKTMVSIVKGEPFENKVDTRIKMITPENMEEPDSQELLNPDLSTWLDN